MVSDSENATMNITLIAATLFACLVGAALLGRRVHRYLPDDHLSADSRDAVKLAMGLLLRYRPGLGVAGKLSEGHLRHCPPK